MCGIAGCSSVNPERVSLMLDRIAHRGPDGRGLESLGGCTFGHVRLSIIDTTEASAQPFHRAGLLLTFNGEVWNYRELRARLEAEGVTFTTTGDTEVMAAVLEQYGAAGLASVDGMFAVAWFDGERAYLARDRFGEIPLHVAVTGAGELSWASELKALRGLGATFDLPPGFVTPADEWRPEAWYRLPLTPVNDTAPVAAGEVGRLLSEGAVSRGLAADVPVCTLLSGGIDSAAVALELTKVVPDLVAYTAVLDPRSRDLKMARLTAEVLGIRLVEVKVDPPTADDLARVIAEIEQPHKAQVEIGWACLALAEAIRSDGFKVTFSGEGSDELWASYGTSYHGITAKGWQPFRVQLIADQARKNFARCNKVFMARSVEVRLPFLHRPLVEYAIALPQAAVATKTHPKNVLQHAYAGRLPDDVVWRPKVAFQDGMRLKDACSAAVADPQRFYRAEYHRLFGKQRAKGVLP